MSLAPRKIMKPHYYLTLLAFDGFPKRNVSGIVVDFSDGLYTPGVIIQEEGAENRTRSDINGKFQITTTNDTSLLSFLFISLLLNR